MPQRNDLLADPAIARGPTVTLRRQGPVLHLTLNRPELRNAMTLGMVQELRQALSAAETDGQTRVIVLRGAGGHFCAGADLKDLTQARLRIAAHPEGLAQVNAAFGELCAAYAGTGLALVAVLEGTVMGGGLGLACAADVTIACDDIEVGLPETSLGVLPAQIAPLLVERLGYAEAKRLAVTGGLIRAPEALAIRLVHQVHPAEQLPTALLQTLQSLLKCAPGALAATKALISAARFSRPDQMVAEAAQAFSQAALGPEGTEGIKAFLEKRDAAWVHKLEGE